MQYELCADSDGGEVFRRKEVILFNPAAFGIALACAEKVRDLHKERGERMNWIQLPLTTSQKIGRVSIWLGHIVLLSLFCVSMGWMVDVLFERSDFLSHGEVGVLIIGSLILVQPFLMLYAEIFMISLILYPEREWKSVPMEEEKK